MNPIDVLVVEDGDEYLTNLSTFVADGFSYRQAKSGSEACQMMGEQTPDLVYLDMRFDRTPEDLLLGNKATVQDVADEGDAAHPAELGAVVSVRVVLLDAIVVEIGHVDIFQGVHRQA